MKILNELQIWKNSIVWLFLSDKWFTLLLCTYLYIYSTRYSTTQIDLKWPSPTWFLFLTREFSNHIFEKKMKNLNFEGSFIQLSTNEETGFIGGRRLKTIHHLSLSTRRCLFERRDVDLLKSDYFFQTRDSREN